MTTTTKPAVKRGFTFTHKSMIDPDWTPGPNQKYADGPKATMIVTRATKDTVWYGYLGDPRPGGFHMPRQTFEDRYIAPPLASFSIGTLMTKAFSLTHRTTGASDRDTPARKREVADLLAQRDAIVAEVERRAGLVERALVTVEVAERVMRLADEALVDPKVDSDDTRQARAREALDMGMERTTTTTCSLVKDQAVSDRISKQAGEQVRRIREHVSRLNVVPL